MYCGPGCLHTVKNKKLRANDHVPWTQFPPIHARMTMVATKRGGPSKHEDILNQKHMPMGFMKEFPPSRRGLKSIVELFVLLNQKPFFSG